jgi:hypothetical protein
MRSTPCHFVRSRPCNKRATRSGFFVPVMFAGKRPRDGRAGCHPPRRKRQEDRNRRRPPGRSLPKRSARKSAIRQPRGRLLIIVIFPGDRQTLEKVRESRADNRCGHRSEEWNGWRNGWHALALILCHLSYLSFETSGDESDNSTVHSNHGPPLFPGLAMALNKSNGHASIVLSSFPQISPF